MLANDGSVIEPIDWRPIPPVGALVLAASVIVPTALVGGWLGGLAWRRHQMLGVLVAISVAWALGIVLLPIAAGVLGLPLRAGISCAALTFCEATLRDDRPLSGLVAYGQLVFGVVLVAYALLVPAFFYWLGRQAGWFVVPVLSIIAAHAVVHWGVLSTRDLGAFVSYACLAIGMVVWALWMRRAGRGETASNVEAARPT